jgi:hypothetical protein
MIIALLTTAKLNIISIKTVITKNYSKSNPGKFTLNDYKHKVRLTSMNLLIKFRDLLK